MNQRIRPVVVHLGLTLAGAFTGTLGFGLAAPYPLTLSDLAGAMALSPLEMTLGMPLLLVRLSPLVGLISLLGAVIWAAATVLRLKKARMAGPLTAAGAALWSAGNLPVFRAFSSI